MLTKHADVARVVKDPQRFPSLTQVRVGGYADEGLSADETYATYHNLMYGDGVVAPDASALHPAPQELTDPWVGPGRCAIGT